MSIQLVITNAGRAALVAAANDGTNAVRIAQVGVSGTPLAATAATAAIPGEAKRIGTIAGEAVANDTMHVIVRDESADVYTVRTIGLYLQDGTLFAAYGQAGVIAEKSAQAMLLLAIDVQFADIAANVITFGNANFLNPPATTVTPGVVELATEAEAATGTDTHRAVTPKGLLAAMAAKLAAWGSDIWRASNDGSGSGLDADLLDGRHASDFALLSGAQFSGPVGVYISSGTVAQSGVGYFADSWNNRAARIGVANGYSFIQSEAPADAVVQELRLQPNGGNLQINAPTTTMVGALNVTGAISQSANQVWHVGNDGAGSGLDADLLDGQQGSYYTAIAARLGYTPANKAGDTFTGQVGFASAEMPALQLLRNGVGAWWVGGTGNAGVNTFSIRFNTQPEFFFISTQGAAGFSNTLSVAGAATFSSTLDVTGALRQAGNQVWHVGNDGSGSGLDADLLDGRHASDFALLSGAQFGGPIGVYISSGTGAQSGVGYFADNWNNRATRIGVAAGYSFIQGESPANGSAQELRIQPNGGNLQINAPTTTIVGALNVTGAMTRNGNQVWDIANDGSGSGLDADLLDGQHGTYYTAIAARLGYTPANKAGDTFIGDVNLNAGLNLRFGNAVVLRGDGGTVTSIFSGSTSLNFRNAGDTATIAALTNAGAFNVTGALSQGGNQVWHVGNDGAGSGLDADLLDGRQAAEFALLSAFTNSLASSGYQKLPGGLILQWGQIRASYTSQTTVPVMFPIAFPNACFAPTATGYIPGYSVERDLWPQICGEPTTSGMTIMLQSDDNSDHYLYGVNWWALGW